VRDCRTKGRDGAHVIADIGEKVGLGKRMRPRSRPGRRGRQQMQIDTQSDTSPIGSGKRGDRMLVCRRAVQVGSGDKGKSKTTAGSTNVDQRMMRPVRVG
jgi:hypothetical protein